MAAQTTRKPGVDDRRGRLSRRQLIRSGALGAGALALGPGFWRDALASTQARPGGGPYGPLGDPDANGLRLPRGFRSRVVARGLTPVAGTAYVWHIFSDGQATYPTADGGFVLVSNCEAPAASGGGASAIRFTRNGGVASAYRILSGTDTNCSGGKTPWNTWLSCEETDRGRVWECDPFGAKAAVVRPAMGVFNHEAAAVDPDDKRVYLTEDEGDGGLYRFTPDRWRDLSSGLLEVAVVARGGDVTWRRVPDPSAATTPTRKQVPGMARFRRGEGIWFDAGVVYVATTSDSKVHAYETVTETIEVLYDKASGGALKDADNLTVSRSGDIFVCEDADNLEMCVISREREIAPFLQVTGPVDSQSELTGVVFDPSGTRLFFSSQRAFGSGAIYEVTGPFRTRRPPDRYPPRMKVDVPDSISLSTLLARGVPVRVRVDRGVRLELAVHSARTIRPKRRRGRAAIHSRKARRLTFARRKPRYAGRGTTRLRLRPTRRGRRKLRERRINDLVVAVVAVDANGTGRRRIVEQFDVKRRRRRRRGR